MCTKNLTLTHSSPLDNIVEPLLNWYRKNARDLPWRQNTDPYRVWISEIMLQQTRVEPVKVYYNRFLEALPNLESLAGAPEELLLKLWEGLGYYTRVRNLHKAAQMIMHQYKGVFPNSFDEVRRLPGIGPYTAGAICSIAFNLPTPAVDGNVLRVITRLTANDCSINNPAFKKQMNEALRAIYPKNRCGDFTQSLMELGALICLPNGAPKCEMCPLGAGCLANATGTQLLYPIQKEKAKRKIEEKTVFLLRCNSKIALDKRAAGGLLSGMWQLPNTESILTLEQAKEYLTQINVNAKALTKHSKKKHVFTHIEWHMQSFVAECADESPQFYWATTQELEQQISLPTAFKKFIM